MNNSEKTSHMKVSRGTILISFPEKENPYYITDIAAKLHEEYLKDGAVVMCILPESKKKVNT